MSPVITRESVVQVGYNLGSGRVKRTRKLIQYIVSFPETWELGQKAFDRKAEAVAYAAEKAAEFAGI